MGCVNHRIDIHVGIRDGDVETIFNGWFATSQEYFEYAVHYDSVIDGNVMVRHTARYDFYNNGMVFKAFFRDLAGHHSTLPTWLWGVPAVPI